MSFAEYVDSITPEWLTAIVGRFSVTFGQTSDDLSALLRLGARDAMVSEANDDCLNNHVSNSEMTAILGEPPFATRSAMVGGRGVVPPGTATALTYPDRWLLHRESGSAAAIADAAKRYGCPNAEVWSTFDLIDAGWNAPLPFQNSMGTPIQGFFFVVLPYPNAFSASQTGEEWAAGEEWAVPSPDPVTGGDDNVWGGGSSWQVIAALKTDIQRYKPATTSCRFIVVANDAAFTLTPNVSPGFTGSYTIYPMWEWYESIPPFSSVGFPYTYYNFSPIVQGG